MIDFFVIDAPQNIMTMTCTKTFFANHKGWYMYINIICKKPKKFHSMECMHNDLAANPLFQPLKKHTRLSYTPSPKPYTELVIVYVINPHYNISALNSHR